MRPLLFAARNLRREFRGGELVTLAAALILAVAALSAVGTLASRVERAILASAAELIGGDAGISLRGEIPAEFADYAREHDLASNQSADFPSVAFAGEASQFVDVRATDSTFPLRGELLLRDAEGNTRSGHAPHTGDVYVEHRVLIALGQPVGGHVQLGGRELRIAAEIISSPDGGSVFQLAPRLLMALEDAEQSGLLGVGSRARHRLMVSGHARGIDAFVAWAKPRLPAGGELVTLESAQENLRTAFERGESFLRLAALLAALLAGIAVALAAQRFARRKTEEVALLRCLGASRREILLSLLLQLALLAVPACLIGLALGLGLQQAAFALAADLLPGAAPAIPLAPGVIAVAVGMSVLFGFALPPLLRLREVEPMRVFRRESSSAGRRFDVLYLLPLLLGVLLIWLEAANLTLTLTLSLGLLGVALLSWLLGLALLHLLRRIGGRLSGALRFGLANLARRRNLSLIQAAALALSLTALNVLAVIGPSLLGEWRADLAADTPNYFLLNVQPDQREPLLQRLREDHAQNLSILPLAVGKLTTINGVVPRAEDFSNARAANWINGEVRVSWSADMPASNRLLSGQWNGSESTAPQVSVEQRWAESLNLKLGDRIGLTFGDQSIEANVSSVREVDWNSFQVNFFMMLDPRAGETLPHSYLTSFHLPPADVASLAALSQAYPNVSLIDVSAILDRVRELIERVSDAVTWVLGFSLAAGILVLLAALAATADERRFESALLRTLGASRGQIRTAVLAEFAALGVLCGVIGALGAAATGWALARHVFKLSGYLPPLLPLLVATLAATLLVTLAGGLGTLRMSRTPPMAVLRRGQ